MKIKIKKISDKTIAIKIFVNEFFQTHFKNIILFEFSKLI
jgi:hypothetical protein